MAGVMGPLLSDVPANLYVLGFIDWLTIRSLFSQAEGVLQILDLDRDGALSESEMDDVEQEATMCRTSDFMECDPDAADDDDSDSANGPCVCPNTAQRSSCQQLSDTFVLTPDKAAAKNTHPIFAAEAYVARDCTTVPALPTQHHVSEAYNSTDGGQKPARWEASCPARELLQVATASYSNADGFKQSSKAMSFALVYCHMKQTCSISVGGSFWWPQDSANAEYVEADPKILNITYRCILQLEPSPKEAFWGARTYDGSGGAVSVTDMFLQLLLGSPNDAATTPTTTRADAVAMLRHVGGWQLLSLHDDCLRDAQCSGGNVCRQAGRADSVTAVGCFGRKCCADLAFAPPLLPLGAAGCLVEGTPHHSLCAGDAQCARAGSEAKNFGCLEQHCCALSGVAAPEHALLSDCSTNSDCGDGQRCFQAGGEGSTVVSWSRWSTTPPPRT